MDYNLQRRLTNAAIVTGLFMFCIIWTWLVATEGFLIGALLGWIPATVLGIIAYWLAPIVWIVLLLILIMAITIL